MQSRRIGGRGSRYLTEEEKQNKPEVTSQLLKRIFSYLLPYWKQLCVVIITIMISAVLGVYPTLLTGRIIDEGLLGKNLKTLLLLIIASFVLTIASNLVNVLQSYINTWVAQHIIYDMRNNMFTHLQKMSHNFFTTNKQGDIITRMTSDIDGVRNVIVNTLTSIIQNIATLIVALAAMYQKNWILATLAVVLVPLLTIPTKRVGKTRWSLALESQKYNDQINQILNETLSVSGQMLVKLFTKEKTEYDKYEASNREMVNISIKESMVGRWFRVVLNTFTSVGPMLIYLGGGMIIIFNPHSNLTVGDITVMVTLLSRMYRPVNSLMNVQVDVIRSLALFSRIFEYFDIQPEIENAADAIIPSAWKGKLEFDNVVFSYSSDVPVLRGITFSVPAGKSVALVGASGAGKSTIINLIPRVYDVQGGSILLDGTDIRKLDLNYLRRKIGMVTQDTYLFNATLQDNLLYAKADATQEELEEACRKANVHDFIMSLPDKYETIVGNRGLKLSGGEKQRVSIARVILKDPPIIIFDEATSSLDSISENLIQDAIEPLLKGRTSIVIAHRLSTILTADEILVIKEGVIKERGVHSELVIKEGIYTELYETQFRRAIEEHEERKISRIATTQDNIVQLMKE
ncbi:MAG TPA: ABC transporter ATP-binding protein [Oscillospiraceae bacterium]|nr:ABC transporter ATP-binding protein [Oscillospiraceae bacterium]